MTTSTAPVRWSALIGKAPLAGFLTLQASVVVATVAFALAGLAKAPTADTGPRLVLATALAPVLALATVAGLLSPSPP
jgi:hypothetical protein